MEGTTLGPYRIIDVLGRGGRGQVYRAHDPRLQREVAVRLLPGAGDTDVEARARLLRVVAELTHPHICAVHEIGEANGQGYVAMELVEGEPLDRLIAGGGLRDDEALTYGVQMADAVAHAHARGVLHRALTTANMMVTSDRRVKVLDFGVGAGALAYLSPEQLRGEPATAASDVWAMGVILYEMVAGTRPFDGPTAGDVTSAILEKTPGSLALTVPAVLRGVIGRCLPKQPSHRYRTAEELHTALLAIHAGLVAARSHSTPVAYAAAASSEGVRGARHWLWRVWSRGTR